MLNPQHAVSLSPSEKAALISRTFQEATTWDRKTQPEKIAAAVRALKAAGYKRCALSAVEAVCQIG